MERFTSVNGSVLALAPGPLCNAGPLLAEGLKGVTLAATSDMGCAYYALPGNDFLKKSQQIHFKIAFKYNMSFCCNFLAKFKNGRLR